MRSTHCYRPDSSSVRSAARVSAEALENRLLLSGVQPMLTEPPFVPVPARIEAEHFSGAHAPSLSLTTVYSSPEGNPTNYFAVVNTQPGDWLYYNIHATQSAIYRVRANVSDFWSGAQFHI